MRAPRPHCVGSGAGITLRAARARAWQHVCRGGERRGKEDEGDAASHQELKT